MNIGILIPGFGASEEDWALPVYQNFVRELAKTHDVRVIALRYPHTRESYTYHNATVYPLGWGVWTRGMNRFRLWWDTYRIVKRLHNEKPFDILHGIWADETGALSGWIGNHLDISSVVSIAGGELVGFPDISYGLQISRYGRWVVNQALKHNTHIVYPSNMSIPNIKEILGENSSKIYLGNNYDTMHPLRGEPKPNHLIHVGSLIPVKNQHLLLDTMHQLPNNITLDIVGEGVLEEELKVYAQKLGISDRVNFLGRIPHTELFKHYSQAELNIITSRHESYCMAILEAGICGTPTVGTRVGIMTENWVKAFTRNGDTANELATQIMTFLESHHREKWMQIAYGYDHVRKYMDISTMTIKYTDLYQNLLN